MNDKDDGIKPEGEGNENVGVDSDSLEKSEIVSDKTLKSETATSQSMNNCDDEEEEDIEEEDDDDNDDDNDDDEEDKCNYNPTWETEEMKEKLLKIIEYKLEFFPKEDKKKIMKCLDLFLNNEDYSLENKINVVVDVHNKKIYNKTELMKMFSTLRLINVIPQNCINFLITVFHEFDNYEEKLKEKKEKKEEIPDYKKKIFGKEKSEKYIKKAIEEMNKRGIDISL